MKRTVFVCGVVVAIALEFYRRAHGRFPETLAQLTPTLLPHVPDDRITGDPVRYRLVNGRPLIYSLGPDGKDDGGHPADANRLTPTTRGDLVFGKLGRTGSRR